MAHYTLIPERNLFGGYAYLPEGVKSSRVTASTDPFMWCHDLLDHQNGPEALGTVTDELEAFGAMWTTRLHMNYLINKFESQSKTMDYIKRNLHFLIEYTEDIDPATVSNIDPTVGEYLDPMIYEVIQDLDTRTLFEQAIVHHMKIGQQKCLTRFGSATAAHQAFLKLNKALNAFEPPEGRPILIKHCPSANWEPYITCL